jgi:hypothetical protein
VQVEVWFYHFGRFVDQIAGPMFHFSLNNNQFWLPEQQITVPNEPAKAAT